MLKSGVLYWCGWGFAIILQNCMFTLTSRARNSDNIWQHAITLPIAQLVYFCTGLFAIDNGIKVVREGNWKAGVAQLLLYVACTSIGSLSAHYFALKHKKRRLQRELASKEKEEESRKARAAVAKFFEGEA